jgi:hypothetical protein
MLALLTLAAWARAAGGLSIKDKLRSTLSTEQADPVMGRRSVRVAFKVSFSLHSATWILFRSAPAGLPQ